MSESNGAASEAAPPASDAVARAPAAAAAAVASEEVKPAAAAGSRLWGRLSALWSRIYFPLHCWWVILNVWMWNWMSAIAPRGSPAQPADKQARKKSVIARKLVHVGDEFALGVGDWVTLAGASGLLHYVVLQHPQLLSPWTSQIEAARGATSDDWVPGMPLFEAAFHAERGTHATDADIVMITVGANDTCPPSRTADNILSMCVELRSRAPNRVVVVNIPPIPAIVLERGDESAVKRRVLERNEAIRERLLHRASLEWQRQAAGPREGGGGGGAAAPAELEQLERGTLRFGVDLHKLFERQPDAFNCQGLFLKPRAYREAARLLQPRLAMAQRMVEVDSIKALIDG